MDRCLVTALPQLPTAAASRRVLLQEPKRSKTSVGVSDLLKGIIWEGLVEENGFDEGIQ